MKCHIIGNGYSRNLFEGSDDFKICLNLHSYDCDLLFAVDDCAIEHLLEKDFYGKDVVISDHYELKHERIIDRVKRYRKGIPFKIEGLNSKFASFNVGHCAYSWSRNAGYEEIHLWGFDLFFERTLLSLSDSVFGISHEQKVAPDLIRRIEKYRQIWERLIDTPTYIHMPARQKIQQPLDNHKYVKGLNHGSR